MTAVVWAVTVLLVTWLICATVLEAQESEKAHWRDQQQARWDREDEERERSAPPVTEDDFRALQRSVIDLKAQVEALASRIAFGGRVQ